MYIPGHTPWSLQFVPKPLQTKRKQINMSLSRLIPASSLHCLISPCIVLFIFSHSFPSFASPLSFNITNFGHDVSNTITYEGDATASNGAIELINSSDSSNRMGWATYAKQVHLWDRERGTQADFSTHFSFTIGNVNASTLGFFLAPAGYINPLNSDFPMPKSKNHIVAVKFENYPHSEQDPPMHLVKISENSISSDAYARWDDLHSGKKANVWISYNATTKNLSVFWTYEENPTIRGNSHLSCSIDLKDVLPEWVTIGFLAATSSKLEWHSIHSWDFHSNLESLVICNKKRRLLAVYVVVSFLTLLHLVGIISWLVLVKRRRRKNDSHGDDTNSVSSISTDLERGALPKKFSYQELVAATGGFANDRRLGQGGSCEVYRGTLGALYRPVAVKRIFTESQHCQSLFINEVKIISRLIHRNLVQFIGWCHEQGEFLLVYKHMPNGSLDNHLFGNGEILPWNLRYKIALGLASALHYLHEEAENCVLHRDIKSANVLLDADFSAKLGDFGLAELLDPQLRIHSTGVVGTYGYLAPEYVNEGKASKASDVFSFGVVALEIACGRRTYQDGEFHVSLVRWIWQLYLEGDILKAVDERLSLTMSFNRDEMERLLIIGLWCTHSNYKERPKTEQVIKVLQLEAPLPELSRDMYDPFFQSIPPPQGQFVSFQPSITSSLNYGGR